MKDQSIYKSSQEIVKYDTFQDNLITCDTEQTPINRSEQKRIIFALIISTFFALGQYECMSAFFIPFKVKNHPTITDFQVGLLMGFYQGFVDGHIYVACYAIAVSEFSQNRGEIIGKFEAGMGFGIMMGAPIGQTFSVFMSYPFIFFGFGMLLIFSIIVTIILLPNRVNQNFGDQDCNVDNQDDVVDVSYSQILRNKTVLTALFFNQFGVVVMLFNSMLITNQLVVLGVPDYLTAQFLVFWLTEQKVIIQSRHLLQQAHYLYIFKKFSYSNAYWNSNNRFISCTHIHLFACQCYKGS
ncbi:permeases of the major facilitator superfamily [Stylonychia lemnae]|uniref:Permeases of the major facilitator superfamily n=1 Tax=Stylonychia lemnae TaxID=5949 RepID=A0A077ZP31_STYLE|nr:permeases of the major facilitator superfamily [Stylonychia lemnae]|eukprot:CDW71219.1 permeases of the major facilitator superfamily [Stylonychia lemnae]